MQQLQTSRGKLSVRRKVSELLNGELFIDYTNGKKYDTEGLTNSYEMFVGVDGAAYKIGGQGVLSFIRALDAGEGLPKNPVSGGIYYVTEDINLSDEKNSSTGKDYPEFKKGDLAVYVGEAIHDTATELMKLRYKGDFEAAPGWIRINNAGGSAYDVEFDNSYTNLKATNVQEAIVELDRHKLAYGGLKFQSGVTTTDTDVNGKKVIDTGSENFTIPVAELFEYVNAGYYYSVGTLASNTKVIINLTEDASSSNLDSVIILEEGDYLAVTSDATTNDKALTVSDVTFKKISGGTHNSERINYQAGKRNDTYVNSTDKAWDDKDAAVQNVKAALDDLFLTKADLTKNGKIPLTQLPDTLINSMEFQGSFVVEEGNTFALPTAANKTARTDETTEVELVQGDYWIYSGPQIKISNNASVKDKLESSEGYLNSGDWLVYNGEGAAKQWSVIDNTSPIQSISVIDDYHKDTDGSDTLTQETVDGNITFAGVSRTADRNDTAIKEIEIGTDHVNKITIHSDNAALISDENKADINGFYKENGSKTLVKSGVSETDEGQLIFNETNGVQLTGGVKAAQDFSDTEGNKYTTGDSLDANIVQNPNQASKGDINLLLPAESGTLARLEDVGLSNGTNFFIPRFKDTDEGKRLVDSPIELIDHTEDGDSTNIVGLTFHGTTGGKNPMDSNIIFQKTTENVTHVMPKHSGIILNTNSIIDCGEWTDDGLVFEHEGDFNMYWNGKSDIASDDYIAHIRKESETIDAVITD